MMIELNNVNVRYYPDNTGIKTFVNMKGHDLSNDTLRKLDKHEKEVFGSTVDYVLDDSTTLTLWW